MMEKDRAAENSGLYRSLRPGPERMRRAALAGVDFLLGFTLSAARVAGDAAPFGAAAVASGGIGSGGVCRLAGACLGYLAVGGLDWGVRYAAACVMVFTVAFVFRDVSISRRRWFMPLAAAGVMALAGVLGSFSQEAGYMSVAARIGLEAVLAAAGTYFFAQAADGSERATESAETRRLASIALLAACCLMSLSRLRLFSTVSVGRTGAVMFVMLAAIKGGPLCGAAAGTALGLAMDVSSGGTPFFTMAYAFSGMLSGMFGKQGRAPFLLLFIAADALAVAAAWAYTAQLSALFETFAASVLFMLLPPAALERAGELIRPAQCGSGESGLRRFAARRVKGMAAAFGQVCEVVRRNTEPRNDADVARIFDRAADACCVGCKRKNQCWTRDYMDTLDALNSVAPAMRENGLLSEADLPERFRESCIAAGAFVSAVNSELRSAAYRRAYSLRLEESRDTAWSQYQDFAEILSNVSGELGAMNGADPLAERRLSRYLRGRDIDADAAVFRDGGGRLRAVIEGGRLSELTEDPDYLNALSGVLGAPMCCPEYAGEGRLTLLEAEPLAVSVGVASMRKRGESVNGDKGTYFKTDSGSLCVILSDGMGAGEEAARESVETVRILEQFLRSGVEPATAMKILGSVMLLRNGEDWGFATVDLMCVDLFTGETAFYKYGAAPSFVRQGKSVRRISGDSLAAGFSPPDAAKPGAVRMRLKPGSFAVIASDGVVPGDSDGWLRDLMTQSEGRDMKQLARDVIKAAEGAYGQSDDMTVLAVRVDERVQPCAE